MEWEATGRRSMLAATLLLMAVPCIVLASGCYASVGPTIGYHTSDGFTLGAEADAAGLIFAHGNAGFFMRGARDSDKDHSKVATFYGSVGPGFYATPYKESTGEVKTGGIGMIGIGVSYDRESEASLMGRLSGGPSFPLWRIPHENKSSWNGIMFNCMLGISYWGDDVWYYVSPQVGVGYFFGDKAID
jgi:hypothetical protein